MGENLKLVWAEFSTFSLAVLMLYMYLSMWTHTHIYSRKLSPGLDLLASLSSVEYKKIPFPLFLSSLLSLIVSTVSSRLNHQLTRRLPLN
jgi:hypothetical protein